MGRFEDLIRRPGHPAVVQEQARNELPSLLALSKMSIWKPGDSISLAKTRFLIGIAVWSVYDMKLLDALQQALSGADHSEEVEVFNIDDCLSPECIAQYVASLPRVHATPIVGVFRNGKQFDQTSGCAAREFVANYFDIDVASLTG